MPENEWSKTFCDDMRNPIAYRTQFERAFACARSHLMLRAQAAAGR